jgi:hypothetical protein
MKKVKKFREILFLLATFLNYTILGAFKMTIEAIFGVTASGKRLTVIGRINHFIVQGTNVTAYWWVLNGRFKDAGLIYAVSWAFDSIQYYPEILVSLGKIVGGGFEKRAERLKKWLDSHKLAGFFFVE